MHELLLASLSIRARCSGVVARQDVYRWCQSRERREQERNKKRDDEKDVKHKDDVRGTKRI